MVHTAVYVRSMALDHGETGPNIPNTINNCSSAMFDSHISDVLQPIENAGRQRGQLIPFDVPAIPWPSKIDTQARVLRGTRLGIMFRWFLLLWNARNRGAYERHLYVPQREVRLLDRPNTKPIQIFPPESSCIPANPSPRFDTFFQVYDTTPKQINILIYLVRSMQIKGTIL